MPWEQIEIDEKGLREFNSRYKKKCKFLVDESLGEEVARLLKEKGWNAKYIGEFNLAGQNDKKIFQTAYKKDRILLTHDEDFLNDSVFSPNINPGVIIIKPGANGKDKELLNALWIVLNIIGCYREIYRGSKIIISEDFTITIKGRNCNSGAMEKTKYKLLNGNTFIWKEKN